MIDGADDQIQQIYVEYLSCCGEGKGNEQGGIVPIHLKFREWKGHRNLRI